MHIYYQFQLPEEGWEGVPFVRYQHTKFFISERAAFIGLFSRVRNSGRLSLLISHTLSPPPPYR